MIIARSGPVGSSPPEDIYLSFSSLFAIPICAVERVNSSVYFFTRVLSQYRVVNLGRVGKHKKL